MVDEIKPDSPAPRPRWPFTRRQVFAQIGVAVVILVSGMGIGTGGTILTLKDRINWHPRRFPDRPPRPPVQMWQTEYGLTDDQTRQVEEAFNKSWASMRTIFDEVGQKQQAVHAKLAEDMKSILTPEQYQKWDQEFKERAKHFRGMRPGGPPGEHNGRRPDHGSSRGDRGFGPPPGPGGPEPPAGEGSPPLPPPQE